MLVETSGIVEKEIAAGKTLDQIKADGLPENGRAGPSRLCQRSLAGDIVPRIDAEVNSPGTR